MRTAMGCDARARVLLGGRVEGYWGAMPGVAEEVCLSLAVGQPVFLVGGFGGCTRDIAETVGLVERRAGSRDDWAGRERFCDTAPNDLRNGLTFEENAVLAKTPHIQAAVALVSRGLRRVLGASLRQRVRDPRGIPKPCRRSERNLLENRAWTGAILSTFEDRCGIACMGIETRAVDRSPCGLPGDDAGRVCAAVGSVEDREEIPDGVGIACAGRESVDVRHAEKREDSLRVGGTRNDRPDRYGRIPSPVDKDAAYGGSRRTGSGGASRSYPGNRPWPRPNDPPDRRGGGEIRPRARPSDRLHDLRLARLAGIREASDSRELSAVAVAESPAVLAVARKSPDAADARTAASRECRQALMNEPSRIREREEFRAVSFA